MKFLIALTVIAAVSADVSHLLNQGNNGYNYPQPAPVYNDQLSLPIGPQVSLPTQQYLPPQQFAAPTTFAEPSFAAPQPIQQQYLPPQPAPQIFAQEASFPIYSQPAPVYSQPAPVYSQAPLQQQYLPPVVHSEPAATFSENEGYNYKNPNQF